MGRRLRRLAGGVLAAGVVVTVSGCTSSDGPLASGQGVEGVVSVCSLHTEGHDTYFGELLTNDGDTDVVIESIEATEVSHADVAFLLDPQGQQYEYLGTGVLPPVDGDSTMDAEMIERLVEPEGATISAGDDAVLLVSIAPTSESDDGVVDYVVVTYRAGSRTYVENIDTHFIAHPGASCDDVAAEFSAGR